MWLILKFLEPSCTAFEYGNRMGKTWALTVIFLGTKIAGIIMKPVSVSLCVLPWGSAGILAVHE